VFDNVSRETFMITFKKRNMIITIHWMGIYEVYRS